MEWLRVIFRHFKFSLFFHIFITFEVNKNYRKPKKNTVFGRAVSKKIQERNGFLPILIPAEWIRGIVVRPVPSHLCQVCLSDTGPKSWKSLIAQNERISKDPYGRIIHGSSEKHVKSCFTLESNGLWDVNLLILKL